MRKPVLTRVPTDISSVEAWQGVRIRHAFTQFGGGAFRVVAMSKLTTGSNDRRIRVNLIDEDGNAITALSVAFGYSTAELLRLGPDFEWQPSLTKAFVTGYQNGNYEMILGSDGVINEGEVGGVTVCALHPKYPSDEVSGLGMLPDHTGLSVTFQLQTPEIDSIGERLDQIEARVTALENA